MPARVRWRWRFSGIGKPAKGCVTKNRKLGYIVKDKKQLWQAVKFTLFSISAGVIQVGSFAVLELFIQDYWVPYLLSLTLSILWNFTLNRRYTFQSAANVPVAMAKVFGFYLVFTPLSTWLGNMAEGAGINDFVILIVTMLANFVLEFLFCKLVVYRGQENTRGK
jgi:putative flippase GtrA